MIKRFPKLMLAALGLGTLLQFGGCLFNGEFARRVVIDGVTHEAFQFLLDNNAIFDLFAD